jgi:hypothetical protein
MSSSLSWSYVASLPASLGTGTVGLSSLRLSLLPIKNDRIVLVRSKKMPGHSQIESERQGLGRNGRRKVLFREAGCEWKDPLALELDVALQNDCDSSLAQARWKSHRSPRLLDRRTNVFLYNCIASEHMQHIVHPAGL